jgi:hypothetical protein
VSETAARGEALVGIPVTRRAAFATAPICPKQIPAG